MKFQFVSGETKGMIEGYSNMPFWNHDLKLKAVLALLDSVDSKDFFDSPNYNELDDYTKEIIKAIEFRFLWVVSISLWRYEINSYL